MRETTFLIVDADDHSAAARRKSYKRIGNVWVADTIAHAAAVFTLREWTGLVLEAELPDGSGVAFLNRLRVVHQLMGSLRLLPVLFCARVPGSDSGPNSQEERLSQARELGAVIATAPDASHEHERFARLAVAADYVVPPIAEHVAHIASFHRLTMMQTRVLALAASGLSRAQWCRLLGVSDNTLKCHIARMCRKSGARSVIELARPILRRALAQPTLR